ncbi:hypothetical protein DFH06DRAFT_1145299 [Mycena polygramma]|nr:hypothetical protein DFH06DRAFT_1145299 [Mycena polygramma]
MFPGTLIFLIFALLLEELQGRLNILARRDIYGITKVTFTPGNCLLRIQRQRSVTPFIGLARGIEDDKREDSKVKRAFEIHERFTALGRCGPERYSTVQRRLSMNYSMATQSEANVEHVARVEMTTHHQVRWRRMQTLSGFIAASVQADLLHVNTENVLPDVDRCWNWTACHVKGLQERERKEEIMTVLTYDPGPTLERTPAPFTKILSYAMQVQPPQSGLAFPMMSTVNKIQGDCELKFELTDKEQEQLESVMVHRRAL